MRRTVVILATLLLLTFSVHAQDDFHLTILHTNDTHAHHDPDGDGNGGVALLASVVGQVRAEAANTLLLDAGDRFTGSLFHTFYRGQDSARIMDALGYDAMTLGSYELTHGAGALADFMDAVTFPVVVSNGSFDGSDALKDKIQRAVALERGGERIGIVGVTRADSRIRPVPGVSFDADYLAAVQSAVDALLADGVNKVILLSHLNYFDDLELGTQLAGVDVIVGGNSNTLLSNTLPDAEGPYPAQIDGADGSPVLVVQAWMFNRVVGRLNVTFDAAGVLTAWDGDAVLLSGADITPDADMQALVDDLRAPLGDFLQEVIGDTTVDIDGARETCRFAECTMGNLITDALRAATGVQIALHNGGGIRASIPAGQITVASVLDVLPFSNTYVTFELTGSDLIAVLENSVSRVDATEGTGRFLQVSGLKVVFDGSQPIGQRIVRVEVLGADGRYGELDPDDVYTVAINDFLFAGGDDYSMFDKAAAVEEFGITLDEIVRQYIAAQGTITPALEDRIARVDR